MKNYFKFTSIGAALVLSGILIAISLPRKAGAQNPSVKLAPDPTEMWTVTLAGQEVWPQGGFTVYQVSASHNAPRIVVGSDLSESLNFLRQHGGQVTIHNWGFLTYTVTH